MKKVFLFLILICLGFGFWYYQNSTPVTSQSTINQFVVNQGDGIISIAKRLEANKLIKNQYVFLVNAYRLGLNTKLQAGSFKIDSSNNLEQIITTLSKSGSQDYWLKIIDGQRLEEITPKFDQSNEGYLFPDSYLIPSNYSPDQIFEVITQNFQKKFAQASQNATNTKLTDAEIITLASLIEREGRTLETKQKIAGVLMNRLDIGMALQIDATVQYARDSMKSKQIKDYWAPVSKSDLKIVSPYNTYLNPGLPPSPICSPGYNSIYAAFHPIASDYLYYITDNDGLIHFATTLDQHNQNIAKFLH
ncbi:MAG TPA: endolytic transglycosylase MltG [Candidatus Woesebacteria bacterium]|nr:endolytic transglycosylase MltG [Candidatus Woesebacteria bacterium]HPJ16793.1 endolytic transglycosylase MltG [Candidatus Woesebacteria bacterium]